MVLELRLAGVGAQERVRAAANVEALAERREPSRAEVAATVVVEVDAAFPSDGRGL